MNREETQSNPVIYSIGRRQKEDTHSSSPWMQTHISKLFLFFKIPTSSALRALSFLMMGSTMTVPPLLSQTQKRMQGDKLVTAQCSPLRRPALDACGWALSCQHRLLGSRRTSSAFMQTQRYGIYTSYFPFTLMSSSFEA